MGGAFFRHGMFIRDHTYNRDNMVDVSKEHYMVFFVFLNFLFITGDRVPCRVLPASPAKYTPSRIGHYSYSYGEKSALHRAVILNRGPHGPPGGNLQVLGRNTEHLGNWGGMDPFGGNQQIAINNPGCSSGWRIVALTSVC